MLIVLIFDNVIFEYHKDCFERPRKVGARFTGEDIAPDEYVQPVLKQNYDAKRDRWNGYDPSEHKKIIEEFEQLEETRKMVKAELMKEEELEKAEAEEAAAKRGQSNGITCVVLSPNQILYCSLTKYNRLDELYYSSMGDKPQMANLWKCFKTLLLLSHGNATVEGGFSVNGDILVENLVERSVVAQRTIFDALRMAGGALSINIDKEMLVKVRSSHSALKDHMEKMRKAEKEGLKGTEQRKRDLLLLKEKEAKKRKLQEEFEKASADVVALQKKVCEKR